MKANPIVIHARPLFHSWRMLSSNWIIGLVNKCIFALFVASLFSIIWRWAALPPTVPLWYSRPWGDAQLAHPAFLFLLPLGGLILYGLNLILAVYVTSQYLVFTQTLFLASFVVNFLSFITLVKILFLIT